MNEFLVPNLLVLALNSLVLSLSAACFARAKYHSHLARSASAKARADRNDARKWAEQSHDHAERLDLPRLLPFAKPQSGVGPRLAELDTPG